jgi:hypothetical protein
VGFRTIQDFRKEISGLPQGLGPRRRQKIGGDAVRRSIRRVGDRLPGLTDAAGFIHVFEIMTTI